MNEYYLYVIAAAGPADFKDRPYEVTGMLRGRIVTQNPTFAAHKGRGS